jgi:hypothetical protein
VTFFSNVGATERNDAFARHMWLYRFRSVPISVQRIAICLQTRAGVRVHARQLFVQTFAALENDSFHDFHPVPAAVT